MGLEEKVENVEVYILFLEARIIELDGKIVFLEKKNAFQEEEIKDYVKKEDAKFCGMSVK